MSEDSDQLIQLTAEVPSDLGGQRLDQVAAQLFDEYSRSRLTAWIKEGRLTVDDAVLRPKDVVHGGAMLSLQAEQEAQGEWVAQDIPLNIVYEDEHILVIDKPAGLVVHPGAGTPDGTILNALLHRYPGIAEVPRAGIVHRLDKDTTGLMVVAKTIPAQTHLVEALQARQITREYEAVAIGHMTAGGTVDAPIGRHPTQRTHMAVVPNGRPSVTHYRVHEKFRGHTRLRLRLETGRTHQIRVHMAHIKHPLVGDPAYGGRLRLLRNATPELTLALRNFNRQALHATMLKLAHPITGEVMEWHSATPQDMLDLMEVLRADTLANPDDLVWS